MVTVTPPPARVPLNQLAALVLIIVVIANAAFFFLSGSYASARSSSMTMTGPALDLDAARMWFAIMTVVVGGGSIAAAWRPRLVGHALGAATGIAAFACGIGAGIKGMPGALTASLVVLGVLMPILVMRSLKGSRAAWSFLTVICAVLGVCLLFGAPKVRGIFDIGLWSAMIIPGLLAIAAAALTLVSRDYQSVGSLDATDDDAIAP